MRSSLLQTYDVVQGNWYSGSLSYPYCIRTLVSRSVTITARGPESDRWWFYTWRFQQYLECEYRAASTASKWVNALTVIALTVLTIPGASQRCICSTQILTNRSHRIRRESKISSSSNCNGVKRINSEAKRQNAWLTDCPALHSQRAYDGWSWRAELESSLMPSGAFYGSIGKLWFATYDLGQGRASDRCETA